MARVWVREVATEINGQAQEGADGSVRSFELDAGHRAMLAARCFRAGRATRSGDNTRQPPGSDGWWATIDTGVPVLNDT